ncbi:hypothetical protein GLOTRDRAFT_134505 [Gloeophyllum trabeum ATCC 11539]|uniref:Uncharacterized protein n=1 Tax=Gloeophyllum trabeum (strain ATCC 11539 / FP-39264 / Madison 617) TaxID=670483 RepID=S7PQX9_GLOTA|nr:uncharacterized protein GLOTRDRAFT_134505 [Gloeophyllum trabeum ATCC 11539]EPQ49878.1 hypothetical protein GLOTRDRAFT_134505 [Gloeophyllum trabeum ATCC 11539]
MSLCIFVCIWTPASFPVGHPELYSETTPTIEDKREQRKWEARKGRAAGEIWLALEDGQKVHVKEVKMDPLKMWEKLREVHVQQKPGARFC